jgi:hypothetical protein
MCTSTPHLLGHNTPEQEKPQPPPTKKEKEKKKKRKKEKKENPTHTKSASNFLPSCFGVYSLQ